MMTIRLSMQGWSAHAPKEFRPRTICPIPCSGARFVVMIAGRPYAGFVTRAYAEEAINLWAGEANGCGMPLRASERDQAGWPAIRGLALTIVER
jgi:hypothetical protein